MKNFFCVGQKIINRISRNSQVITKIYSGGKYCLDDSIIVDRADIQCLEEYQDPTNYFYHHSKYGEAITQLNFYISDLLFWMDTVAEAEIVCKGEGRDRFINKAKENVIDAENNLEKWLMIKRTSEHNLCQWSSGEVIHVLAQHMPFLNPEDCKDYIK